MHINSDKKWLDLLASIADETDAWKNDGRSFFYCLDDEETGLMTCGLNGKKSVITSMICQAMNKSEVFKDCVMEAVKLLSNKERRIHELPQA